MAQKRRAGYWGNTSLKELTPSEEGKMKGERGREEGGSASSVHGLYSFIRSEELL
jgi:hypothetical protein